MNLTFLWLFVQFSTCQVLALPCPSDFNASLKVAHHTFLVSMNILFSHSLVHMWVCSGMSDDGGSTKEEPKGSW